MAGAVADITPDRIAGGYILLSRQLMNSEIWNQPPLYLKIWMHLLVKAEHRDGAGGLSRGQCLVTYEELIQSCSYYAGYRLVAPKKSKIADGMRSLREANMIHTAKTTRGVIVTICKYETYQDARRYESNSGSRMNPTRTQQEPPTIDKKREEEKKEERRTPKPPAPQRAAIRSVNKALEEKVDQVFLHAKELVPRELQHDFALGKGTLNAARENIRKRLQGRMQWSVEDLKNATQGMVWERLDNENTRHHADPAIYAWGSDDRVQRALAWHQKFIGQGKKAVLTKEDREAKKKAEYRAEVEHWANVFMRRCGGDLRKARNMVEEDWREQPEKARGDVKEAIERLAGSQRR